MAEPSDETFPLVRTERLELVDDEGNVRLVGGDLGDRLDSYGVLFASKDDQLKVALEFNVLGVALTFIRDGNEVLKLGVSKSTDTDGIEHEGAMLRLCDNEGRPIHGWWAMEGDDGA